MASWGEFSESEPEMAKVLESSLAWIPITYLATTRKEGSPRVHPICPIIGKGRMFVAVNESSPKRFDLRNDGRYAMHALPGKDDAEFYMTGRVTMIEDAPSRELCVKSAAHTVHEEDWIFEFELERVMTAYWEKVGEPDTYAVRKFWHAP
ncbi:MAG TPA: pyridoxamine 5'-phosphate oxidase family protein [Dehalococcoidia bacterium]|nr:pyridoxamine 5'-phosphate oxidase family protein [Dehalococcoidia bacterium]